MTRRHKARKKDLQTYYAKIESLSHDCRGVARLNGKTVFIDEALTDEIVFFKLWNKKKKYLLGAASYVLKAAKSRIEPVCEFYEGCGGCCLQHLDPSQQIIEKQNLLMLQLRHSVGLEGFEVLPPIAGADTGYRRKARLGVKFVRKKDKVLVGFREKRNSFLADIKSCEVLHSSIGERIEPLKKLIGSLSVFDKIPQIEIAVGDHNTAIVLRHLEALTDADKDLVVKFSKEYRIDSYLQPGNIESIKPLYPGKPNLYYGLKDFGLKINFKPTDFTQVNAEINQKLVSRVIDLFQISKTDRILDLFCGIGNFSLPMAKRAEFVLGIEGDMVMVNRATKNKNSNKVHNVSFECADLTKVDEGVLKGRTFNKVLIDPPRTGALEIIQCIGRLNIETLVYVSCNVSTFVRDAEYLVNELGYTLNKVGVVDMFPHTAHVETVAIFKKI